MEEKYFATIMGITELADQDRVCTPKEIILGNIDPETKILTSSQGDKYREITDFSNPSDDEDIVGYYYNLVDVDKLDELFKGSETWIDAMQAYEKRSQQIIYFISRIGDSCIIQPIDKQKFAGALEEIHENQDKFEETTAVNQQSEEEYMTDEDEEEIVNVIRNIVLEVYDGKLSPDELIDLQENLEGLSEEISVAINSVKMQRDSLEADLQRVNVPQMEQKQGEHQQSTENKPRIPTPTLISDTPSAINLDDPVDIESVYNKITKTLIAQDKAARRTVVEISRLIDMEKRDYGILLTGNTGVGKSLLMRLLAKHLNRPFLKIDATQVTAAGFVGRDIEEYLWELYESCGKNKQLAEQAIVFIDEIDKKGSAKKSDGPGQGVLNMLLKFIEGTSYVACKNQRQANDGNSVVLSTDKMIVVGGGAYLDVYKWKGKKQVNGFADSSENKEEKEPSISDFVTKAMMTEEIMGRLPIIIHLDDLDIASLKRVMLESDESALTLQQKVFGKRGVKLSTKEGYVTGIAEKTIERKAGARGLNKYIADSTYEAYDHICCNPGVYSEVILTEETVDNPKVYQLVRKEPIVEN